MVEIATLGPKIFVNRNSCRELFCEKGVCKNSAKFRGKHLRYRIFFNKVTLLKKETQAQVFSCEFCNFF